MASDREKWSNYAHSCISGTHGTHAVVPGRAPSLDSPSEKWNRTFAYHLKGYKFCLIGLLWIFRCRYLLKISNVIKRRNGSFEKLHWTSASRRLFLTSDLNKWVGVGGYTGFQVTGMIEGSFWVWNFWFRYFFAYESFDLRGDFLAYSKHSEVVILHNVIDETEDVLGCLECVLGFLGFC